MLTATFLLFLLVCALQQGARAIIANSTAEYQQRAYSDLLASYVKENGPLTFCIADWMPFVVCNPNNTQDTYTGHDVEIVRLSAGKLNLVEGEDYNFKCILFSEFRSDLTSPGGQCDAAICGITVTTARIALGYKYTYPYYSTGLGILVRSSTNDSSGWAWVNPFSLSLWIGLFATILFVPLLVFLQEFYTLKRKVHLLDIFPGYGEATWRAAWTLTGGETFNVSSFPARITLVAFAALCFIVSSTYTANLAAFLTVSSVKSSIRDISDLRGRVVHSAEIYQDELRQKYGIYVTVFPVEGSEGMRNLANRILMGDIAASIQDAASVQYIANSVDPSCHLLVLPEVIEPFDYAMAFRYDANSSIVDSFSHSILLLQEDGTLQQLESAYITGGEQRCNFESGDVNTSTAQITFHDLYGLWVVCGAVSALGVLSVLFIRWRHQKHWRYLDDVAATRKAGRSTHFPRNLSSAGAMPPINEGQKSFITQVDNRIKLSSLQEKESAFSGASQSWTCVAGRRENDGSSLGSLHEQPTMERNGESFDAGINNV